MADVRLKIAKQLRELLETTDPAVRLSDSDAVTLRNGLEVLTAQLEAGLLPGPTREEVRAALVKEGVPATGSVYVVRVLDKLGVF